MLQFTQFREDAGVAGRGGCCHSQRVCNHYDLLGLKVTTMGAVEPTSRVGPTDNHGPVESVDFQMVGAARVAQELNVRTDGSPSR